MSQRRPDRKKVLFEFLFAQGREEALSRLSRGIYEIIGHASNLLEEAQLLAAANRFDRAIFLVATAEEELGKLYILIDMCRVDFTRHDILMRLCGAFYNHILKRVYLDYSANHYPGITTMAELKYSFTIGKIEWWPGDPEDGEPDMPNETSFLREDNLYVDVDSYADSWVSPDESSRTRFSSDFVPTPIEKANQLLVNLKRTHDDGLFAPAVLSIVNRFMKSLSLNDETPTDVIKECYEKIGRQLDEECGIDMSRFVVSQLHNWPLYWIK
jgi:AbiV family abortive infection protein